MPTATPLITRDIAKKVLDAVDCMSVEAAVCHALGLPHDHDSKCVSPALRMLIDRLSRSPWSSPRMRAKGLRRLALAQLGSAGVLNDKTFARRVAEMTIRTVVPRALRSAAEVQHSKDKQEVLIAAAERCEREGTPDTASAAEAAATAVNADTTNADFSHTASYAASAASHAARGARAAAADAIDVFEFGHCAVVAAAYAADAAYFAGARDAELAAFAESILHILIEMGAPGCQWLDLADAA
jgi:hypothetical protein